MASPLVIVLATGVRDEARTVPDVVAAARAALGGAVVVCAGRDACRHGADETFAAASGEGGALRAALERADGPVVLLGGDQTALPAHVVSSLAAPVLQGRASWALPSFRRHRFDCPVELGLVYPVLRALYRAATREAGGTDQALAPALVERLLAEPWPASALNGGALAQVALAGACALANDETGALVRLPARRAAPLAFSTGAAADRFLHVAETLLELVAADAERWLSLGDRYASALVPEGIRRSGDPEPQASEAATIAGSAQAAALPALERFADVLGPQLGEEVATACGFGSLEDEVYADVLAVTLVAVHRGLSARDGAEILLPAWLARTARYRRTVEELPAHALDGEIERLPTLLEARRSRIVAGVGDAGKPPWVRFR
jgi:hypothetical protein